MCSQTRKRNHREFHYKKQDGKCIYCRKPTWLPEEGRHGKRKGKMATVEHIIPRSRGETYKRENLAMSCLACNNRRKAIDHFLFLRCYKDWQRIRSLKRHIAWSKMLKNRTAGIRAAVYV